MASSHFVFGPRHGDDELRYHDGTVHQPDEGVDKQNMPVKCCTRNGRRSKSKSCGQGNNPSLEWKVSRTLGTFLIPSNISPVAHLVTVAPRSSVIPPSIKTNRKQPSKLTPPIVSPHPPGSSDLSGPQRRQDGSGTGHEEEGATEYLTVRFIIIVSMLPQRRTVV